MIVKKRAWNLLITVFAALVVCTVLSAWVEQQMTAQAVTVQKRDNKAPLDALVNDSDGTHLYEIAAGEGWESGLRIREIPGVDLQIGRNGVSDVNGTYHRYVNFTSKPVADGDLVCVAHQTIKEDQYLVVWTEENAEIEEWLEKMESGVKKAEKSAVLLSVEGKQPFMEVQAGSRLAAPEGVRIYSLNDAADFKKSMPLLAICLILIMILFSILVQGFMREGNGKKQSSRIKAENGQSAKGDKIILRRGILTAALLLLFSVILSKVSLPSSMLPGENIFQITYYIDELKEIQSGLEAVR